jgi:hypothetical protein
MTQRVTLTEHIFPQFRAGDRPIVSDEQASTLVAEGKAKDAEPFPPNPAGFRPPVTKPTKAFVTKRK